MEDNNFSQLELFSGPKGSVEAQGHTQNSFLGYVRNHEKAVVLIICFILNSIILFSLGVERGKRIVVGQSTAQNKIIPAQIPVQKAAVKNKLRAIVETPVQAATGNNTVNPAAAQIKEIQNQNKEKISNYTVQLASYKSKSLAQKEAETLKKKGLTPVLVSKGNYNILCVGNFADREAAKSTLTQLKKKYQDGFIRRL